LIATPPIAGPMIPFRPNLRMEINATIPSTNPAITSRELMMLTVKLAIRSFI
jgi:hypothetical protein